MPGGQVGAKVAKAKPYEHQHYPKVLHGEDGSVHLAKSEAHQEKLVKFSKVRLAESPADFLPEDHPDHPLGMADIENALAEEEGSEDEVLPVVEAKPKKGRK